MRFTRTLLSFPQPLVGCSYLNPYPDTLRRGQALRKRFTKIQQGSYSARGVNYEDSSSRRFLSQRALAALRADSNLSSLVILAARAGPPFKPPRRPSFRALRYPKEAQF